MVYYHTKFYSFWSSIDANNTREFNNDETDKLDNELQTVLGDSKLISMTSAASNGILVTTIAYLEEEEVEEK